MGAGLRRAGALVEGGTALSKPCISFTSCFNNRSDDPHNLVYFTPELGADDSKTWWESLPLHPIHTKHLQLCFGKDYIQDLREIP